MLIADLVILYVDKPPASAAFYAELLGQKPVASSDDFAMVPLGGDIMLGLWSTATVEPPPSAAAGGQEIALKVDASIDVDAVHARWLDRGIRILQPPRNAEFGRNFLAADPDGHRLRVIAPA